MIKKLFMTDYDRYDGIPLLNIYLMRAIYALMLVFVGKDSWSYLLGHKGQREPFEAMGFCVWAAFATMAPLGIFHTVRMIPILLFEIFYKVLWLLIVAYPLWSSGKLAGSPAEGIANAFVWVILAIIAIPWPYVARVFLPGWRPHGKPVRTGTA